MKKNTKIKTVKAASKGTKKSKKAAGQESELPSLVMAMAKLVERLESVERKVDQVLGRVTNLPSEIKLTTQNVSHAQGMSHYQKPHQPVQSSDRPFAQASNAHQETRRERVMYQAICADCDKPCEVPFKPTAERPVYCKECFSVRKGGGGAAQKSARRELETTALKKPTFVIKSLEPNSSSETNSSATAVLTSSSKTVKNKKKTSSKKRKK